MIEDLVQMGPHLVLSRIDVRAELPRMVGNLIRSPQVFYDAAAHAVAAIGQLGIDNLGRNRLDNDGSRRQSRRRRRRLGRGALLLRPLLALGLRFGLSPHLGHATEKIFDFVFHGKPFHVPRFKFHVHELETWNLKLETVIHAFAGVVAPAPAIACRMFVSAWTFRSL